MLNIVIENICAGCGNCAEQCPTEVFEIQEKKAKVKNVDDCMACRLCEVVCPFHAIKVIEK